MPTSIASWRATWLVEVMSYKLHRDVGLGADVVLQNSSWMGVVTSPAKGCKAALCSLRLFAVSMGFPNFTTSINTGTVAEACRSPTQKRISEEGGRRRRLRRQDVKCHRTDSFGSLGSSVSFFRRKRRVWDETTPNVFRKSIHSSSGSPDHTAGQGNTFGGTLRILKQRSDVFAHGVLVSVVPVVPVAVVRAVSDVAVATKWVLLCISSEDRSRWQPSLSSCSQI